ncbi:hypothetical protein ACEWY4_016616 [Coilia grayii]|uniref:THD domain-containing protein n=1 Tax=Coilia grayii TaxID=363190 RepID=A0ABD1JKV0_9TELE
MDPRQPKLIQPNLVTSRAPINVIITIIGVLQVVCCVIIGLHLTGYFQVQGTEREPSMGKTAKELQHKYQFRVHKRQRPRTPVAHLPIKPPSTNGQREVYATIIHWNADRGHLSQLKYGNGRILFQKPGVYYVYAKTCFRYYSEPELSMESHSAPPNNPAGRPATATPSPVQLIQYIFLERPSHGSPIRPLMIMKTGSTNRWRPSGYHMSCQQQGGVVEIKSGDGLYVSVSNAWMLDPEAEGSYFGAFRIAE